MIESISSNYQPPLILPDISCRLNSFFAECFQRIQDRRPQNDFSLREFLGVDHALDRINSGPICDVVNYLWVSSNTLEALSNYSQEMREELIFPALFSRALIVRRPKVSDSERIFKKLYMSFPELFAPVVYGNGVYGSSLGMVLQSSNAKHTKNQTYGAIHYIFKENVCQIFSLVIHKKKRGLKYGSLLLNAAIIDAKKSHLKFLELDSTREGASLYLSLGFIPSMVAEESNKLEWWKTLSLPVKIKIVQEMPVRKMVFDLSNIETAKQSLRKALNFFDKSPQSLSVDYVEIPQETYAFGLM